MGSARNELAADGKVHGEALRQGPTALYPETSEGVKIFKPGDPEGVETAFGLRGTNQVRVRFRDGLTVDIDGKRLRQLAEAARDGR